MNARLDEIISTKTIDVSDKAISSKEELFDVMADMLYTSGYVSDKEMFITSLFDREHTGSTYMGNGIAIPHGKSSSVNKAAVSFMRCRPFMYDPSEPDEIVNLVLMLAIPKGTDQNEYISMLANLTKLFLDDDFVELLTTEKDERRIMEAFNQRFYYDERSTIKD